MSLRPAPRRSLPRWAVLAAAGTLAIVVGLIVVLDGGLDGRSTGGAASAVSTATPLGASATRLPATPGGGTQGAGTQGGTQGAGTSGGGPAAPSGAPPSLPAIGRAGSSPDASPSSGTSGPSAPTSAAGFRPRATIIAMGPLFRTGTRFTYGDAFAQPRDGVVYPYNLARGVGPNGKLLRAHDGQDLIVPIGTIVLAPFAGVVVDPATIWQPWDPQRYGKVIVVRSTEPTSSGYYAILVHLSRQSVPIGATVRRGQVVGRTGDSGNDRGLAPQLHFELRAPFEIRYGYGRVIRWVDCFDPLPSLRAAFAAS